jgi:geranylgeranyl diphosphate synthase, type I
MWAVGLPAETGRSPVARTTRSRPPILSSARELSERDLRDAIGRLHPVIAAMCEYHFGWRDAEGKPTGSPGTGRGVCLALPVLSARAVGAPAATAVPGAVALELVHVFTHVHDDIMDGDTLRRHEESLWKVFGVGPAILTGDAMFALALAVLVAVPAGGPAAMRCVLDMCLDLAAGQALDLEFEKRPVDGPGAVDLVDYLAVADGKTGALYGCGLSLGAVLAEAPDHTVRALAAAGRKLGIAAQVADDIVGMWGDPAITGKPVLGDLARRKKSLPVLAALAADEPVRDRFVELWSSPTWDEPVLRSVREVLDKANAREFCEEHADRHLRDAIAHLDEVAMPEPVRAEILGLAHYIRHRRG